VSEDSDLRDHAQWSPDSNRLAYVRQNHSTGKMQIMEWSSGSRNEEPLAPPTDADPKIFDWSSRSNSLLIAQPNHDIGKSEIAVLPLTHIPRGNAVARTLLSDAAYDLYQARFSPDERWIVFEAVPKSNNQPAASAIYVSPASGRPWIRITDGKRWDDKPRRAFAAFPSSASRRAPKASISAAVSLISSRKAAALAVAYSSRAFSSRP
jgi:hypothetical protein